MRSLLRSLGRRYTLLVIPDNANGSRRLRISILSVFAAGSAFALLLVTALTLLLLRTGDADRIHMLYRELASASAEYADSLEQRERSITQLQDQVTRLMSEAGEVKLQLEQLAMLESELDELVGVELPGESSGKAAARAGDLHSAAASEGIGGEDHPLSPEDANPAEADISLTALKHEAAAMQLRLEHKLDEAARIIEKLRITPTRWPADSQRITSEFGARRDPFTGRRSMHSGIDLGGKSGDPIYAAADGIVTESAYNVSRGHYIVLTHPSGLQSVYMHLRKRLVKAGERVEQGRQIGQLGSTGRSTGPHLHFEIWQGGDPVDPLPYISLFKEDTR